MKATRRLAVSQFVIGGVPLLVVCALGAIPVVFLMAALAVWLLNSLYLVGLRALTFRVAQGVIVTPMVLAVNQATLQQYYWRDVKSISTGVWREGGWAGALFGRLLYGSEANVDFVKVSLRKTIRMPWWTSPWVTRGWVIPLLGANTIRVYVENPESFVKEAQKHLIK
jgi:hypothetical protein